ncbi:MAG TPA: flagellar export chaperone FliS [Terriglobia bacterium]|jgi:flagellar biosynthetic protein FliS|nr:flagellar export chaperone FliS [Terriglobia bacterium]
MNSNPVKSYRDTAVHSSNAADIFIQCYEEVIRLLHAAARAMDQNDIESKTQYLNRVLTFIVHLQGTLDFTNGGQVSVWLDQFYRLIRAQIFDASAQRNPALLRQAADYFADVRKLWEGVPAVHSADPAGKSLHSPQDVPFQIPDSSAPANVPDTTGTPSRANWRA